MKRKKSGRPAIIRGVGLAALFTVAGFNGARAEPPIQSPEDAACRAEAKAKVFSAPNPKGLDIEQVGRGIYSACMKRIAKSPQARGRRRHAR